MEADARGQIEVGVGVMHCVQSRQGRDGMEQHVLEVDHQIEDHHADEHGKPSREFDAIEQAPAFLGGERREGKCRARQQHAQHQGVEYGEPEIGAPAQGAREARRARRRGPFPQGKRGEHGEEHGQPQRELGIRRNRETHAWPHNQLLG